MDVLGTVIAHPQSYLLVVARLSGLILIAPVLGATVIPPLIRVALVLVLAWALFPLHGLTATEPQLEVPALVLAIGGELVVGFTVGFIANLVFTVFQAAGSIIGTQMGFGIIQIFDPVHQQRSSVVDEFYSVLATLLFLMLNGHHMLLMAIDRTYQAVPSGAVVHPEVLAMPVGRLISEVIGAGFQMALPIMATLLLTDLAFALASRAVPQINVFFLGLPVKVLVGMVALSLALPASLAFMRDEIDTGTRNVLTVMGGL